MWEVFVIIWKHLATLWNLMKLILHLCWNTKKKTLILEKNDHRRWKVDCLQQRRVKNILKKTKWATIKQPKSGAVYLRLGRTCAHLPKNQMLNSSRLKAAIDETYTKFDNWKSVIILNGNNGPRVSLHSRQKLVQLD